MDKQTIKTRHEQSKKDFPTLKLEDDEFVEFAFSRAKICLVAIFGGVAAGMLLLMATFALALTGWDYMNVFSESVLYVLLGVLLVIALLIGVVALTVYRGNRLFITNKHAIQMVMKSPFATSVNMIDLPSIEDASYREEGILQKVFRYGTLRLSTVGDETTYTFEYSNISPEDLKAVSKLVTEAKKESAKSRKD